MPSHPRLVLLCVCGVTAAVLCGTGVLPLASLRLMASPLQLTYSFMWQVIRQRNVKLYSKVEEFITMVTQAVPELMTFKQTAQLLLGLRARVRGLHLCVDLTCARFVYIVSSFASQIILDLLNKEGPPDSRAIQILINRLKVSSNVVRFEVHSNLFISYRAGPSAGLTSLVLGCRRTWRWRNPKRTSWCWSRICRRTLLRGSSFSGYLNLL